jgi:hypothetical protein
LWAVKAPLAKTSGEQFNTLDHDDPMAAGNHACLEQAITLRLTAPGGEM